jgi:hypothetical protein
MSLTNIVYTPVDTGTAKVSPNVENTKVKIFYLLAGKLTPVKLWLRRSIQVLTPDQLTFFRYIVIVISSMVPLMINSVALIFIISNFCSSSSDFVVTVFVL